MPSPPPTPHLGDGRYQLQSVLGRGTMAIVARALDTQTGEEVAIKMLTAAAASDEKTRARFLRECELLHGLDHPHIVSVTDFGSTGETAFMVMELMQATALDRTRELGGMPVAWVLHIANAVLDALQTIHERGVVHRDIKPANILISAKGVPKLSDFGVVSLGSSDLTVAGTTLGTQTYRAPEQSLDAADADARSDIYGLGASLYTLAIAKPPPDLSRLQLQEMMKRNVARVRAPLWDALPTSLRPLIRKACGYHPEQRYQTAREMRKAVVLIRRQLAS